MIISLKSNSTPSLSENADDILDILTGAKPASLTAIQNEKVQSERDGTFAYLLRPEIEEDDVSLDAVYDVEKVSDKTVEDFLTAWKVAIKA